MRNLPVRAQSATPLRQLNIPFDSARIRGMTPAERQIALGRPASLLLEAAGVAEGERDDDKH